MCFRNVLIVPTISIVITELFHEHVCTCNKLFYLTLWSSIDKGLNSQYNLNEVQSLHNGSDGWQQSCLSFNTDGRLQIKGNSNKICKTEKSRHYTQRQVTGRTLDRQTGLSAERQHLGRRRAAVGEGDAPGSTGGHWSPALTAVVLHREL